MVKQRKRTLREQEMALWQTVTRDVVPLRSTVRLESPDTPPDTTPDTTIAEEAQRCRSSRAPEKLPLKAAPHRAQARLGPAFLTVPRQDRSVTAPLSPASVSSGGSPERPDALFVEMMKRTYSVSSRPMELRVGVRRPGLDDTSWKSLTRGTLRVEAKLDLHGYIVHDAFECFLGFLHRARSRNLRCVEVVTGLGSGVQSGTIRRELPLWLQRTDVRDFILGVVHTNKVNRGAVRILLKTRRPS